MVQVNVKVEYLGKNYMTNVITTPQASDEEIQRQALEQVMKQWAQ
ncbi:BA3454 family stress response protein [Neobacillus notoginsengisoli]|uniref:BA3454 family stress response protein n=1 Tax=Neobacillus notoginsengisoli TaxID=1578198 RepID=A0A417YWX6_9BACI|nr:BA3454 family stress response protein [Neobacillus notoginsengisoli]RHW42056.1 BA3454 family stress response protein [Neobacillus notoginsengisoli]